ncbi:MAG: shikimate dehydrogenase [Rhodospirillaceae bacterium]|nr:MAG: shikimate dehydrogenase [Rhodospirillaceae bacterium]
MTITGKTKVAGVMGWPVSHSKSPALHGFWLREHGIDGVYIPLPVKPENLRPALRALPMLGFVGVNLTVPHKEAALKIVDEITPTARRVGAINAIVVRENGRLSAENTDVTGFMMNLRLNAPAWDPKRGPAVVLGAGGASRAVCVGLIDAGCPEIRLVNRTPERVKALKKVIGGNIVGTAWDRRHDALADAALLVNTTTLGMEGQPPLELDLTALPSQAIVNDIVYAPLDTPLLLQARARGLTAVDGLGMLLYQAVPAFEAWFGVTPEVTPALRAHILGLT